MPIDWIYGLIGGALIGVAGALFLLLNGRIMGASGILGSLADGSAGRQTGENIAFIAGLIAVPGLLALLFGPIETNITSKLWVLIAAGLLVGVGTRLANGCTSGHGVCGISRLSLRGIVATVFYILAGGVTVVLFKHILGVI
ncbi:YeeE/YedE family protein [Pseudoruegeria sp. SHC-113]|uniref:YeeE/YedE family protein n=1 Tax=Pseudoruegeria sp. SHC-113 TaxID=2855439 RepID=UPI0021BB217F|nr:YeeE/YedE thiosulfate transporter family protein [Pseudoruegeria sp. SHC-113]MCT8159927.1 YeeE/YedE family protein [Pseudoruegeria sp. SHC-113]